MAEESRALREGVRQRAGCLAPMVFGLLLVAGVTIFVAVFLDPIGNVIEAMGWERVPCTIVGSRVEQAMRSNAYVPDVKFSYRYEGVLYHSSRVWFIRPTSDNMRDAAEVVKRYPKGLESQCYVDPEKPGYAVLERGVKPELLIALVPLGLVVIGMGGLVSMMGPMVFPASRRRWWVMLRREGFGRPGKKRRVLAPGGPYPFRPRHVGKVMRFFIVFAMLWNGVIVFLVREVVDNWRDGIPGFYGWALTLFAVPMVLIGLAALIPPAWGVIKWLNPRPMLTLSSTTVAIGGEINVRWRFWGSTRRVRRLRLFVEGREEATYRRGTETYTNYEVFSVVGLVDTNEPGRIRGGQVKLGMAAGTVPTFQSEHNAIVWSLRVHGQCGRWPDIDEEFELKVVGDGEGERIDG